MPATIEPFAPGRFLIPAEALKVAARSDKGSDTHFAYTTTPEGTTLTLTTSCCGLPVKSVYELTVEAETFPARPVVQGRITSVPKETFTALGIVAACVSTDATRHILNGVHFTPEEGGMLIATDGRRLAGAPARVPSREFVLPTAAVHVLAHPDFTTRDAAVMQPVKEDDAHLQFRSGPHTLIAKTIEGRYPGYQHVIPSHLPESVTVPENHRPALISWLRSLKGKSNSVRLTWEKPGHLTLTHHDYETVGATIQVPVTTEGTTTSDGIRSEVSRGRLGDRSDPASGGFPQSGNDHRPVRQLLRADEPAVHRGDRDGGPSKRNTRQPSPSPPESRIAARRSAPSLPASPNWD